MVEEEAAGVEVASSFHRIIPNKLPQRIVSCQLSLDNMKPAGCLN